MKLPSEGARRQNPLRRFERGSSRGEAAHVAAQEVTPELERYIASAEIERDLLIVPEEIGVKSRQSADAQVQQFTERALPVSGKLGTGQVCGPFRPGLQVDLSRVPFQTSQADSQTKQRGWGESHNNRLRRKERRGCRRFRAAQHDSAQSDLKDDGIESKLPHRNVRPGQILGGSDNAPLQDSAKPRRAHHQISRGDQHAHGTQRSQQPTESSRHSLVFLSEVSNLEFQISNVKSEISNLKFQI
jgi:hypothetical protein